MTTVDIKLHYYQIELVKRLAITPSLKFNRLIIDGLESEHMNYHLKKLLDLGFVLKEEGLYKLSDKGKDYSNLLDENTDLIEKQAKISIVIHAKRKNKNDEVEHLLMKRLRQPYYGKVGHLTGKVKFGETVQQAAERELFEETGLTAKTYKLQLIYRKMRKRTGVWIQDNFFYMFLVTDLEGNFIHQTPFQENFWLTQKELAKDKALDLYDDFKLEDNLLPKPLTFSESFGEADGY